MLYFESDYMEGAHPKILQRLIDTNMEHLSGYGVDKYTKSAKEKIKKECNAENADIYFLVGGTQTNSTVIASILKNYEGVIAAKTGHIAVHESGAIEHNGHKVLTIPQHYGKIDPKELKSFLEDFYNDEDCEHMVFPGMVYISYPTEYGTLYSESELCKISKICHSYEIPLYLDGARLGYGLMSEKSDLTLPDIAKYCDVFYIGGTKIGALCGEAVVFTKGNAPKHFVASIKQNGALLAKGRLTGIQFDTLFTDGLYYKISRNAIDTAMYLKKTLINKGYKLFIDSPTNQQFVIMDNEKLSKLKENVVCSIWEKYNETHTVIRLATSWATTYEDVKKLSDLL